MSGAIRETARRLPSLLLLLLHMLVAGVAPLADALIERNALDGTLHVESESAPSCPVGHDHLECQLCRHIGTTVLSPQTVTLAAHAVAVILAQPAGDGSLASSAGGWLPFGPRAPPLT